MPAPAGKDAGSKVWLCHIEIRGRRVLIEGGQPVIGARRFGWIVSRRATRTGRAAVRPRRRLLESPHMIDREQVLHVARLARLELTDDEVGRMSEELSAVADYIEKIDELDLDGVAPTTHVVEVSNTLRPDEPQPSLPREVALENAPSVADGGFRVPSPQAG
jgi:aspartyl-tRNA(Asn)/glutamyl-tRNA(Gln) amidotransferase subunit C